MAQDAGVGSTSRGAGLALGTMMFLQYAVWGVWLPYLANYLMGPLEKGGLAFSGAQVGWILGLAGSIGALCAPFLAGQIADRFINAERWLGVLLVAGGVVKCATAYAHDYGAFLGLSILYSICYMPTLALTNSIALAHLRDPERSFPPIRTWGTIGWIVASTLFPLLWLQQDVRVTPLPFFFEGTPRPDAIARLGDCLLVSGVVSVGYGLWAMAMLPKTPPTRSVEHPLAFARAFLLLGHRGFLAATLAALPISMIHQVYFIRTGPLLVAAGYDESKVGPVMSIGQFSEIAVLALLGMVLKGLGYKWVVALGALAFAVRYGIFALASPDAASGEPGLKGVLAGAMVLHGVCYACFFAGLYLYIDRVSPKDVRHSAQTLFGIVILGLGPVLAGFYNEMLDAWFVREGVTAWGQLWGVQAALGVLGLLLVLGMFPGGRVEEGEARRVLG